MRVDRVDDGGRVVRGRQILRVALLFSHFFFFLKKKHQGRKPKQKLLAGPGRAWYSCDSGRLAGAGFLYHYTKPSRDEDGKEKGVGNLVEIGVYECRHAQSRLFMLNSHRYLACYRVVQLLAGRERERELELQSGILAESVP